MISLCEKGNKNPCENHREISLLNAVYRLYTKIVNRVNEISEALLIDGKASDKDDHDSKISHITYFKKYTGYFRRYKKSQCKQ